MRIAIIALAAALVAPAQAQERAADPASARASAPPLEYRSAFAGYRAATDEKPAPWKQVNKEVEGAGMVHGAGDGTPATGATPARPEAVPSVNEAGARKEAVPQTNHPHRH
jgi:hypothetical protein